MERENSYLLLVLLTFLSCALIRTLLTYDYMFKSIQVNEGEEYRCTRAYWNTIQEAEVD